jgi:hypothetical protein
MSKHLVSDHLGISLIRDCLELLGSINKSLMDFVCQLEYRNKIANTEAKAHRDLDRSAVVAA